MKQENKELGLSAGLLLAGALLLSLCGCTSVQQEVRERLPDGSEKSTTSRILATGGAKQAIESVRLSQGKTQSIGVRGTDQETLSPVREFVDLLHEINKLKSPTGP